MSRRVPLLLAVVLGALLLAAVLLPGRDRTAAAGAHVAAGELHEAEAALSAPAPLP